MARTKKPPQKRRPRPRRSRIADMLDQVARETAQDFACSLDICKYFDEQLQDEIERREPMLPLNELAIRLWSNHREELPELVATLEALFEERLRHDAAIVDLSNRLMALARNDRQHADISPVEPIVELVRTTLIEAAIRAEHREKDAGGDA